MTFQFFIIILCVIGWSKTPDFIGESLYFSAGFRMFTAGEAILSISNFASEEVGATRIVASCNQENHRSENVLLRTGFTRKGLGRQYSISLEEYVTTLEFFVDLDG